MQVGEELVGGAPQAEALHHAGRRGGRGRRPRWRRLRLPVSGSAPRTARRRGGRRRLVGAAAFLVCLSAIPARAQLQTADDEEILGARRPYFRVESVRASYAYLVQSGRGYQSRANASPGEPGLQNLTVLEPQLEVVVAQGERMKHRLWVPVDVVTAASPDAVDIVSSASRHNEAATVDWTTTYRVDAATSIFLHDAFHAEENYRSWSVGFGGSRSFAEDNTVLSASLNQSIDWFDRYFLNGKHDGHASRAGTNANIGLTQLLSPTTVAYIGYGLTVNRAPRNI